MISCVLLHINRPYLLEINVKLLRHFGPKDMQIIVADDGSYRKVYKRISMLPVNHVVYNRKNTNTWREGSCSNTIFSAIKQCSGDYFAFGEDDSWFCPNPIPGSAHTRNEVLFPDVKYNYNGPDPFAETIGVLQKRSDIIHAQWGTHADELPQTGDTIQTAVGVWHVLDQNIRQTYYYNNGPAMMRMSDLKKVNWPENTSVWKIENILTPEFNRVFGRRNWAAAPLHSFFIHVGYPFSQRMIEKLRARTYQNRLRHANKIAAELMSSLSSSNLGEFSHKMVELYLRGKFFIDFDELLSSGTEAALRSAFVRLKK